MRGGAKRSSYFGRLVDRFVAFIKALPLPINH
jgi:hypothetical protein